jgi:hypothetical protein
VDTRSALCSSASVTHHYLVTLRHDIPLPIRIARSQRVTTITQVGLRAVRTLHCVYVWLIVFDAVGHEWDEARLPSAVLPGYCRLKQCSPFINWGKKHTSEQVRQFKAPMKSDDNFLLCV